MSLSGAHGWSVVALLAGASPASSCAKACGRSADDVGRAGRHGGDDLGRAGGGGYRPPSYRPRGGVAPSPAGGAGHAGDDLVGATDEMSSVLRGADGRADLARLEAYAASHPPVRGASVSPMIERGSGPRGITFTRPPAGGRRPPFRDDLGATVTRTGMDQPTYDDVIGALLDAQDLAITAYDLATDSPDDDAWASDLELAAGGLDHQLEAALVDPAERARFHALLGTSSVIVYRLASERPLQATK